MTARASVILWSAGGGVLLGAFLDALLVGVWMVLSAIWPPLAPRQLPRWFAVVAVIILAIVPLATGVLGLLEGRLKAN